MLLMFFYISYLTFIFKMYLEKRYTEVEPRKIFINQFPGNKDKFQISIPSLDGTLSAEFFISKNDLEKIKKDIENSLKIGK